MICDLNNINEVIKKENLDVCIVSYGGSCSNTLVKALVSNNYNCITNSWDKILCHCPKYVDVDIPVIYIYDNPKKAFL